MGQHPPIVGQTLQGSLFVALPTSLGTGGPVPQLPVGAGQVRAGSGAGWLHFLGTLGSRLPIEVSALHQSPLHPLPAGLGAFAPLPDDPLGEGRDGIERLLLLLHEVGVFDFRPEGIAHREDLDGQGLLEGAEAADSFQRRRGAAVPQGGALVRDVLL